MKYRFSEAELKDVTKFLSEAMKWVENIVMQVVRLATASSPKEFNLVLEDVLRHIHMVKSGSLFWGLMDMAMLIGQADSMLRALGSGRLLINCETVGLIKDITNMCQTILCELEQTIENPQEGQVLEIELACAQEAQWLIDFLQTLLQEKTSRTLVVVPQPLMSRLPVIIETPLVPLDDHPPDKTINNECRLDRSWELITANHEVAEVELSTSVIVSDKQVDDLLSLIGELGTAIHVFNKMSRSLMMEHNLSALSRDAKAGGTFIQRVATAMEEVVLSLRSVKLGIAICHFPHMAKEIGVFLGKKICLTIAGEQLAVDKTLIRPLYMLLLKIIRTMATVSMESPTEREARGKKAEGHISLVAYSSGKQMIIEVADDGRGMKGGDADAEALEIFDLMVAMNEVYHQMDALPGLLEITNLPGKGSNIKITLPTPLMRCKGLLVEVSGELFIVPVDNVVEIVKVTAQQLIRIRGRQLIYHRGEVVGVTPLTETLGMIKQENEASVTVVIVTNGQDKVGLIIHKIHNEQEILVKSLPDYLKKSEHITGAGVTSGGQVALVLNISALIKQLMDE